MGFTFSGIRGELAAKRFRKFFQQLREECPTLFPFPDHDSLLTFFHDQIQDLDRKDAILFELVTLYRKDVRYRDLAPLFIVLFTPALTNIYAHGRRRRPGIDQEDLLQDICLLLIQTIKEIEIIPYKVAGRIIGELRNRVRTLLNERPGEEFVELKGDGTDEFETGQAIAAAGNDESEEIEWIIAEITAFLDHLIRVRKITKKDKQIIMDTFIGGKALKAVLPPSDYDRLKHRRLMIIGLIKAHFSKLLNLYGE